MPSTIETLKERGPELMQRYGLRRLAVFGSVARGEETPDSDVDVLVVFNDLPTFDGYMGLKFELEDLLHRDVDLAIADTLKARIKDKILASAVDVA